MRPRFYVISGCSSGGKSTLIDALAREGFATVAEPGRRILAQGGPNPWAEPEAFARAAIELAQADYDAAKGTEAPVFFDRGLIDAVLALAVATGTEPDTERIKRRPYAETVFLAPPWPEIYVQDQDRQHGQDAAMAEYERLRTAFPKLGHTLNLLPKVSVADRVAFVRHAVTIA